MTDQNSLSPAPGRKKKRGSRPRHVPVRTCVICREQSTKRQLVRIVRQPNGQLVIDSTGRLNGRGAYLCDRPECWQRAADTEALAKALNTQLTEELRTILRERAQALTVLNAGDTGEKESTTHVN